MKDYMQVTYGEFVAEIEKRPNGRVVVPSCSQPSVVGNSNPLALLAKYSFFISLVQHAVASLLGPDNLPDVTKHTVQP